MNKLVKMCATLARIRRASPKQPIAYNFPASNPANMVFIPKNKLFSRRNMLFASENMVSAVANIVFVPANTRFLLRNTLSPTQNLRATPANKVSQPTNTYVTTRNTHSEARNFCHTTTQSYATSREPHYSRRPRAKFFPTSDQPLLSNMLRLCACLLLITFHVVHAAPVEVTPKEMREAVQPQLAVSPDGTVHVAFGIGTAIYHTSSSDGRSFTPPVKIAELEKLALRMRRGPRIVATNDTLCVTAISHATGTLHGWTSADGGTTWKEQGALNSVAKSAREGMHGMAANGRGLAALAWLDLRSGKTELWSRISQDGGAHWGPEVRVYASPDGTICECCHPTVAIGPHGEIAAMWRNWLGGSRDIWASVSSDGGRTFPSARKLGSGSWQLKGCPMDGGSAVYDNSGKLHTVWRRESTVYSAILGSDEITIASSALQPVVTQVNDRPSIAYEQNGEVQLMTGARSPRSVGQGKAPVIVSNVKGTAYISWEGATGGIFITPVVAE